MAGIHPVRIFQIFLKIRKFSKQLFAINFSFNFKGSSNSQPKPAAPSYGWNTPSKIFSNINLNVFKSQVMFFSFWLKFCATSKLNFVSFSLIFFYESKHLQKQFVINFSFNFKGSSNNQPRPAAPAPSYGWNTPSKNFSNFY